MSQGFRRTALKELSNKIGVYALCDLDKVPIYVGQSVDGIRARVNRHLTSARSDIIANRQIDVWEIAYVMAWPVESKAEIPQLEAVLFAAFNARKSLMNGSIPALTGKPPKQIPDPTQIIQVLDEESIKVRLDPTLRLPRQIEHIGRLVDQILNVKNSAQLRRSLVAHFERLNAYRAAFLKQGPAIVRSPGESDEG